MSKLLHCGVYTRAQVYQLVGSGPYEYIWLYHVSKCKGKCHAELMFWAGEYPNGTRTTRYPIENYQFPEWKRRAEKELARPQPQFTSEYSRKIKGPIENQIRYHAKLRRKRQMPVKV